MTQRMFVCHAKSDIEATSEIVDALEGALELPTGTMIASSLPGYAADIRGEGDLHATLTGATLMLALFTERSTYDPEFVFELGAAWALGIDVLPLLLGATNESDVPWPLRDRPRLRAQDESAWNDLVRQLSHRLQVAVRAPEAAAPSTTIAPSPELAPPFPAPPAASESTPLEPFAPPPTAASLDFEPAPAAAFEPPPAAAAEPPAAAAFEPEAPVGAFEPPPPALQPSGAAEALPPVFDYPLGTDASDAREPVRHPVSVISPVISDEDSVSLPPPAAIPAEAFDSRSDIRSSLPSYQMSLEAGRALSDCVFNREENFDFIAELEEPFGRFVDAVGGSWNDLRKLQDFDVWLGATENLLQNLPAEGKQIGAWYEVGYELAILHNLAGQGLFDSEERKSEAERLWRRALERFLIRAENAHIPYEDLARVLSLLENLVAPRTVRDLSNISRSLDELRRQAAGADGQHTAA